MSPRATRRELLELADKYDFVFDRYTGKTHGRWVHRTSGQVVFTPSTPSDWRSLRNVEQKMRQVSRQAEAGLRASDRTAG
jgi:hypothetical protein